jgi:cell division septation protein DedD
VTSQRPDPSRPTGRDGSGLPGRDAGLPAGDVSRPPTGAVPRPPSGDVSRPPSGAVPRPPTRDDATPHDDLDEKPPGLSVTQIVASALAAVSSTILLSYLGVAGTIIGAGIASVLTVVGNNLYTRSILKTRRQMKAALQAGVVLPVGKSGRKALRPTFEPGGASGAGGDETAGATRVMPAVQGGVSDTVVVDPESAGLGGLRTAAARPDDGVHSAQESVASGDATVADGDATGGAAAGAAGDSAGDEAGDSAGDETARRSGRRRLILSVVGVFAVLLAGVTLVEVVAGRPLSEILRGEEGSGTSISHVVSREPVTVDSPGDTSTDSPSTGSTPTPAPSEAPSQAPTDAPTTVPTPEPTTPVTPDPNPTPGTGGDSGGAGGAGGSDAGAGAGGDGSGTGGSSEVSPGTGSGSGAGSGTEPVPGAGTAGATA